MEPVSVDDRARLLIVDDEPKNLRLLANIFADEYRLSLATSGAKALELLEITPDIDLVLLDLMMPEMDGLEVYDRIRAMPRTGDLPVVFITARNDTELEMKALGSGVADYLLKPVHVGLARVRVQQQITLARHRAELRRARAAADAGNRAKSQFVTAVSHELRTPLNAILGFSQVMQSDPNLPETHRESVQEIVEAGTHLLALINDVLDLGKIEAARVDLSPEPLDLGEIGLACLRLCEPLSQRQAVTLRFSAADDLPLAWADRIRVRQVIVNLLSNAIKYNRQGGEVLLEMGRSPDDMVSVAVIDDGPGIGKDKQERLFEPYVRSAEGERRKVEGTGIGLTICKHLVEMMGGQIHCTSTPGQGTRFAFTLPLFDQSRLRAETPRSQPAIQHAAAEQPASFATGSMAPPHPTVSLPEGSEGDATATVLCVDDNQANLKLLQLVLRRLPGVKVVICREPGQAVALAAEHRPDLALVDIQMPEIDGYEVLRRLRALPPLAHMPIAALSANAMADDIRRGMAAGFVAYFAKPFNTTELLGWVDEALRRTRERLRAGAGPDTP